MCVCALYCLTILPLLTLYCISPMSVSDPPNPPPADPTPSPADPTPSPFGTGPIIAVVLVVLLLAALAVLAFVCWLKNKGPY